MKLLRLLLFPLAPLYYLFTSIRNLCFESGLLHSSRFPVFTIGVGNLTLGGTGKTPMAEYIIALCSDDFNMALLSRGYGRRTKGFVMADEDSHASDIGDEPLQIKQKFSNLIVAVDGNRCRGVTKLLELNHPPDLIVLDDVLQHRSISTDVKILLTTYNQPYFKDYILPIGDLREPRQGAHRADLIVVTKCPQGLSQKEKDEFLLKLKPMSHQSVWFSAIAYSSEVFSFVNSMALEEFIKAPFTLVTGIAQPAPLVKFLEELGAKFEHLKFADHHQFSSEELDYIASMEKILTTEKDFVRLRGLSNTSQCYYLPIKTKMFDQDNFKATLKSYFKV